VSITNFGILAVLELPDAHERELRFLFALGTYTRGKGGWREARTETLARQAKMSPTTLAKAREGLAACGVIEWRRGTGPGHASTYRIRLPGVEDHLLDGSNNAGDVTSPTTLVTLNAANNAGGVKRHQIGLPTSPDRPENATTPNAATSQNANIALSTSTLKPSALAEAAQNARLILRGLGTETERLTDRQIDLILDGLTGRRVTALATRLRTAIGKGDEDKIMQWARDKLAKQETGP